MILLDIASFFSVFINFYYNIITNIVPPALTFIYIVLASLKISIQKHAALYIHSVNVLRM